MAVVEFMKSLGFVWETKTIGIKFENGLWNLNVVLKNEDGSRKPVYGFLKFETADEAVTAENAMQA